jgi:hypothetical protein
MAAFRDLLPVVTRDQYDAAVRDRDEWERRARHAAERTLLARRMIVPAAAQRSGFAVVLAGMWLVVIGVFVGGALIPHHDDRPTLASSRADASIVSSHDAGHASVVCADDARAASIGIVREALTTPCPTSRATPGGSRTQPRRQPQPD